ncbi:MAG: DedA family protein [Rhodoluna sp.]|nr:DedA family protein [Rhodoluna sp.]
MLDPQSLIESFGALAVLGVALILFIETATILGSFLPGDSLIFILGIALSSTLNFPIWLAVPIVIASAIAGSQVGYWVGTKVGPALFKNRKKTFFFNEDTITRSHAIIERYGPRAIVLARFIPVLRALVPMLVGIMGMDSKKYLRYNIIGAVLWGGCLLVLGWSLGNLQIVKDNLELWVIGFVVVSSLPFPIEILRDYLKRRKAKKL